MTIDTTHRHVQSIQTRSDQDQKKIVQKLSSRKRKVLLQVLQHANDPNVKIPKDKKLQALNLVLENSLQSHSFNEKTHTKRLLARLENLFCNRVKSKTLVKKIKEFGEADSISFSSSID